LFKILNFESQLLYNDQTSLYAIMFYLDVFNYVKTK